MAHTVLLLESLSLRLFGYSFSLTETSLKSSVIVCIWGSANDTISMPVQFRVPSLAFHHWHWLPILPTTGCQFCRQSRACAKLPTWENVIIQDGVVSARVETSKINTLFPYKWAAPSEFDTYRLCEQRRFRRACASAQSRQNLRCSLIQAVSQEEPSDRKPDPWPFSMAGHARLKFVMKECSKTQIRLARPKWLKQMRKNLREKYNFLMTETTIQHE